MTEETAAAKFGAGSMSKAVMKGLGVHVERQSDGWHWRHADRAGYRPLRSKRLALVDAANWLRSLQPKQPKQKQAAKPPRHEQSRLIPGSAYMTNEQWRRATKIGGGVRTEGIRRAVDGYEDEGER